MRRAVIAEHNRQPGHAFAPDQANLHFRLLLDGDHGNDAAFREIDRLVRLFGRSMSFLTLSDTVLRFGSSKSKSLAMSDASR
jgi:hypothetical protein